MYNEIKCLQGRTIANIEVEYNEILFILDDGTKYRMFHNQDCCESVYVDEIIGEIKNLIGTPIITAEEREEDYPDASESGTWTFYEFATIKGYVTIRWVGESNGYYSESVCIVKV